MSGDQTEIFELLKTTQNEFLSVVEISRRLGHRKRFDADKAWSRPILQRMEMEGMVESNPVGDFRLKRKSEDTTSFKQALSMPGVSLGDTAIITLADVQGTAAGKTD